jgi:two-component system sensor kinase FixL
MLAVGEVQQSNPRRFVGFLHDITLRRQAEEAARQSEARLNHFARLSTMGEMAAGLAHEINQPLTAIATFSQAATRMLSRPEGIEREDLSEALDQITAQALRAGEVIRRLRAFVKNREVRHERVDCRRVVEDSRLLLEADARSNSVQLRLQVADSLPSITADPVQLQQVLINLVRNAIEASADVPGTHREVILSANLDGEGMVEVAVADHGHGLSTEAAERLFHPFFTTKPGGTGLGLVISSSIIRAHNGRLAYRSTPGGGCTFFFTLPPLGVLPGVESH